MQQVSCHQSLKNAVKGDSCTSIEPVNSLCFFLWLKQKLLISDFLLFTKSLLRYNAHEQQIGTRHILYKKDCIYVIWVKAFTNGPSKTCGRQPLKDLKWSLHIFLKAVFQKFTSCILKYLDPYSSLTYPFSIIIIIIDLTLFNVILATKPNNCHPQ